MDKLITTHNGRMPIVLNDIRFLDGIYRNAFELFLKAMEANNIVLFGCIVSDNGNGTFSVTEGAVVISSEVYLCSAHSFACTNINEAYFVITESFNPEGNKKFGDNVNRDTYQLRRIVAGQYASQPANSISVNATRYEFYTKAKVNAAISAAIAALVDSSPATLDTLNELAAALGDDPNFATTILNELGDKVDKVTGYGLSKNDLTDELVTTIANKVDKVTGYGLSKNDLTDALLAKLNASLMVLSVGINIGSWNMTNVSGVYVSWALPAGHHIVNVDVWINPDNANAQKTPLTYLNNDLTPAGTISYDPNNLRFVVIRNGLGYYDSLDFSSTVINRGTLFVQYMAD